MEETSENLDLENDSYLEMLDEEDGRGILIDDYKDLELELVKPSRYKFLTWNDF